jgi:transcription elongation GreA/GreB family factor
MRVPTRRSEILKKTEEPDRYVSAEALVRLKKTLEHLQKVERPKQLLEVQRLAEMGDRSENFGYHVAKSTLRSMDSRIENLRDRITNAVVIEEGRDDGKVHVGSTVTLLLNDKEMTVTILGSLETSPGDGRISHRSPLGAALLGRSVGDDFEKHLGNGTAKIVIKFVA